MATIIEGGLWTLTNAAAEHLVEQGIIKECVNNHPVFASHDKPIYHISINSPDTVGVTTLLGYINEAERAVSVNR